MDCTAYDDLCHLQRDYASYVHTIQVEDEIDQKTFLLGIFNGREYIYSEAGGKTTIMIRDIRTRAHGPVADIPPDFLETDGTVSDVPTPTGDEHGEG